MPDDLLTFLRKEQARIVDTAKLDTVDTGGAAVSTRKPLRRKGLDTLDTLDTENGDGVNVRAGARMCVCGCARIDDEMSVHSVHCVQYIDNALSDQRFFVDTPVDTASSECPLRQAPREDFPGRCEHCGGYDRPGNVVLPFLREGGGHHWIHDLCWQEWRDGR